MTQPTVVVDGSNLATEGRSIPSLAQLDEAVRAFIAEHPEDEVIVVVDASFGYRIDEAERTMFEEAEAAGEIVSPPAGAVGRGDGFLLRIADRTDATVLSNDSFQEFHGEYAWLFDQGRLIGGKPVPGVGWIFTPRTPVRGPKSRVAVRDAKRATVRTRGTKVSEPVAEAIAEATAEAVTPPEAKKAERRGRRRTKSPEAINEPLPFIKFIAEHPLGSEVDGSVETYTSHGAFVIADGARCYAPVSGLGDPPPRSAKEVLGRGGVHRFVVQALDPPRRGIELALPGLARVAGAPTEETVEAEIGVDRVEEDEAAAAPALPEPESLVLTEPEIAGAPPARKARAPRKAAKTAPAPKAAPAARKAPAATKTPAARKGASKKAAPEPAVEAKRPTATKKAAVTKKTAAREVPAVKKPAAKKAPATKAPATKALATKAPAKTAGRKAAKAAGKAKKADT